ncbi:MAG: site-specific DNA-methyltransferase [Bacteroidia bacterium]
MLSINKAYCMDRLEFLGQIDNSSVDLAIIDPPYNLNVDKWDSFPSHEHFLKFTYQWIDALIPKLKNTGSIYIFNTPFNSAFILNYLVQKKLIFQNWITWDKRDGFSAAKRKYVNAQETILFFTKSKNYTFNYDEIRTPYQSTERIKHAAEKGILKNGKRWYPNPKGKLCTDVWHFASERHKQKINGKTPKLPHITPKPIDLIERIVKASSNEGDLILDCFAGIGTTAIAAIKNNRNFIINDFDPNYVKIAKQQIRQVLNTKYGVVV